MSDSKQEVVAPVAGGEQPKEEKKQGKKGKKEPRPENAHLTGRQQMKGGDKPKDGSWAYSVDKPAMRKVVSPKFTKYYRELNPLTTEEEWEPFLDVMRTPLPTTIWINDTDPMAPIVRDHLMSLGSEVAEPIPWYPVDNMAWRIKVDKLTFRRDKNFANLRRFMITQTASGIMSRQEEVSMIPPFLLDIKPTDRCLDMCASPGSKTAQMLVALCRPKQRKADAPATDFPFDYATDGCIVANELDAKRANMLVHQVKRLRTLFPFALFTNHDARYFPAPRIGNAADPVNGEMEFDKILCDVVCSGDGTIRKSPQLLGRWKSTMGSCLQQLQIEIALRGCHLLKQGGRLVYSTCSLNPIENEAVVQQLVKRTNGAMKIVDVSADLLPGLQHDKGWKTWKVTDPKDNHIEEPSKSHNVHPACFPIDPPPYDMDLSKCLRLLPKHCGGGGFFVCVLEKVGPFKFTPAELKAEEDMVHGREVQKRKEARARQAGKKADRTPEQIEQMQKENEADEKEIPSRAPKYFNGPPTVNECIEDYYKVDPAAFPVDQLVVRCDSKEEEIKTKQNHPGAQLHFVSSLVRKMVLRQDPKCTIVSTGVRALVYGSERDPSWRVATEFTPVLATKLAQSPKFVELALDTAQKMLNNGPSKEMLINDLPEGDFKTQMWALGYGPLVWSIPGKYGSIVCSGFKARMRILIFVDKEEIVGLKNRLGLAIEEKELDNAEAEKPEGGEEAAEETPTEE